jgi:hypothetical protein
MSRRKHPRPKRDRAPLRKPTPEHPLDGLFRFLGVTPEPRVISIGPNAPLNDRGPEMVCDTS